MRQLEMRIHTTFHVECIIRSDYERCFHLIQKRLAMTYTDPGEKLLSFLNKCFGLNISNIINCTIIDRRLVSCALYLYGLFPQCWKEMFSKWSTRTLKAENAMVRTNHEAPRENPLLLPFPTEGLSNADTASKN